MGSIPQDQHSLFPLDDGTPNDCKPMRWTYAPGVVARAAKLNGWKKPHADRVPGKPPTTLRSYNLTHEQFDAMYDAHDGRCAICRQKPHPRDGLHIDHCHKTGRVRGLLCHRCNIGIGRLHDDPVLMQRAIDYITGTLSLDDASEDAA